MQRKGGSYDKKVRYWIESPGKAGLAEITETVRQLKRENAMMHRWLKVLVNPMSIATRIETWTEIRTKLPDLFKAKRRGSK